MAEPFPSTRWSMVIASCRQQDAQWRDRMEEFCHTYWEPIYQYIRQGWARQPDEARDLAQEFFARLIEKPFDEGLRPDNGRFRAYLKRAVKHFLINHRRDMARLKRGGGVAPAPLDPEAVSADDPAPDALYDRVWLLTLLEQALGALEAEYRAEGRGVYFELLRSYDLVAPEDRPSYEALATEHGLTHAQVRNMLYAARKRLGVVFRRQLRELVTDPAELEAELGELLGV